MRLLFIRGSTHPNFERARLALKLEPLLEKKAKEMQAAEINQYSPVQKSAQPSIKTRDEVTKLAGYYNASQPPRQDCLLYGGKGMSGGGFLGPPEAILGIPSRGLIIGSKCVPHQ